MWACVSGEQVERGRIDDGDGEESEEADARFMDGITNGQSFLLLHPRPSLLGVSDKV